MRLYDLGPLVFSSDLDGMLCSFFFFKQKTAYEMRISDWSSDVCSSDLRGVQRQCRGREGAQCVYRRDARARAGGGEDGRRGSCGGDAEAAVGRADREDRKSVVWGKGVSVRVDLGGCRILKTTISYHEVHTYRHGNASRVL